MVLQAFSGYDYEFNSEYLSEINFCPNVSLSLSLSLSIYIYIYIYIYICQCLTVCVRESVSLRVCYCVCMCDKSSPLSYVFLCLFNMKFLLRSHPIM